MKSASVRLEMLVQGLTAFTFVLTCWVAQRVLQMRHLCINSEFVAYVRFDGKQAQVENCRFTGRLDLSVHPPELTASEIHRVRSLERLNGLRALFPRAEPKVRVEIVSEPAQSVQIGPGLLRLGVDTAERDPEQVQRGLIMAVLRTELADLYSDPLQLQLMGEFLTLALFEPWEGFAEVKFPTSTTAYERLRPLLASALWRVYRHLTLMEQVRVLERIRHGVTLPFPPPVDNLVEWVKNTLNLQARALGMPASADAGGQGVADLPSPLKRALKELEVEAPTHWELTVDLTTSPAWREILERLKARARTPAGAKIRTLVFTPEGQTALPSGMQVEWHVADIRSQKHVLVACRWPRPEEAVQVEARQMLIERSCDADVHPALDSAEAPH